MRNRSEVHVPGSVSDSVNEAVGSGVTPKAVGRSLLAVGAMGAATLLDSSCAGHTETNNQILGFKQEILPQNLFSDYMGFKSRSTTYITAEADGHTNTFFVTTLLGVDGSIIPLRVVTTIDSNGTSKEIPTYPVMITGTTVNGKKNISGVIFYGLNQKDVTKESDGVHISLQSINDRTALHMYSIYFKEGTNPQKFLDTYHQLLNQGFKDENEKKQKIETLIENMVYAISIGDPNAKDAKDSLEKSVVIVYKDQKKDIADQIVGFLTGATPVHAESTGEEVILTPTAPVKPTATPLPSPTPLPQPTVEPTIAPTTIPENPNPSAELVKSSVDSFVKAMNAAGIKLTAEQVAQSLVMEKKTINGKEYEVVKTADGYPLMIKSEGEKWERVIILDAFGVHDKEIQVRGEPGGGAQIPILNNFNGINVTTTLEGTVNYVDKNGWSVPDGFANMSNHIIVGQIAWGFKPILPDSVLNLTPDKLQDFAKSQINTVLNHFFQKYPNKQYDWIIAGESTQQTLYHQKLGDPNVYLVDQYDTANKAIVAAGRTRVSDSEENGDKLAYSDFINGVNDPNLKNIITIAKTLKNKNLLDVIYLQLRYVGSPNLDPANPPSRQQLTALSDRIYQETGGVKVIFSEVGIKGKGDPKTILGNTIGACVDSEGCLGVQLYSAGKAEDGDNEYPIFDTVDGKDIPNSLYYEILKLLFL